MSSIADGSTEICLGYFRSDTESKQKKIQGFRDKRSIQQEEESFRQHIGLKVKEETTAKLHFEHGFVWC